MTIIEKLAAWIDRVLHGGSLATDPRHGLGMRGEAAAEKFLKRLGYKIVERRLRTRLGELDIVAVDGRTIVFVEVKTWQNPSGGDHPADAVDLKKQRQLTKAGTSYLKRKGLLEYASRFDVIAVTWVDSDRKPKIEHYVNAFDAVGNGEFFS
ncbi:MAG: YraN family protein [Pirellulales bacterium]|nr:YraN family protein [Pirellulales bacterium]